MILGCSSIILDDERQFIVYARRRKIRPGHVDDNASFPPAIRSIVKRSESSRCRNYSIRCRCGLRRSQDIDVLKTGFDTHMQQIHDDYDDVRDEEEWPGPVEGSHFYI